jgi:hypothetical protein
MAVTILHKRNNTPGSTPTITDLTTGEFGVNAADGEVFFRILIDPAGANIAENQQILAVRRPLYADGGVITVGGGGGGGTVTLPVTAALADSFSGTYNYNWYSGDFNG